LRGGGAVDARGRDIPVLNDIDIGVGDDPGGEARAGRGVFAGGLPAPMISSRAKRVVAEPLVACEDVPADELETSSGLVWSRPEYSMIRMSVDVTALSKVTVTRLAPAPEPVMFFA
jgi:hypothetical protein